MPDGPIQHDVDMEAYDAMIEAAGFEFVEGGDEEVELWFLSAPDAAVEPTSPSMGEGPPAPAA